jgi:hypothetical protein
MVHLDSNRLDPTRPVRPPLVWPGVDSADPSRLDATRTEPNLLVWSGLVWSRLLSNSPDITRKYPTRLFVPSGLASFGLVSTLSTHLVSTRTESSGLLWSGLLSSRLDSTRADLTRLNSTVPVRARLIWPGVDSADLSRLDPTRPETKLLVRCGLVLFSRVSSRLESSRLEPTRHLVLSRLV